VTGFSVKWLGHASFLIRIEAKNIYIDPYQGEYKDSADVILVTHSHLDHCDPDKIRRIRKNYTLILAPKDCIHKIEGKVKTLRPGEKITAENITIEAVEAYNYKRFRSPGNPFHPKGLGVGYLITTGDKTIYHAGDTDFIPEMKQLKNVYLALLPSGGTYTMDNYEAVKAALTINPEVVIPIHRRETDPEVFKEKIEARSNIKVIILEPGQQFEVQ